MDYRDFLARKLVRHEATGVVGVALSDVLYPFQREITRRALERGKACIFADCGLGKTLMQLEWARHVPGDVLILAPLAVTAQTAREGRSLLGLDCRVVRSQAEVVPGTVSIANYEMLHALDPDAFTGVVLDESSILKAYDGRTRTAIIDAFRRTPFRLACTATPAPNDHMELGNHAEFVGAMTRSEMLSMFFCHDGGKTQNWRLKGHAREEFWSWVSSWAEVVRTPSDLGYSDLGYVLPPLQIHRHVVEAGVVSDGLLFHDGEGMSIHERRAARRNSLDDRVAAAVRLVESEPGEPWLVWCDLNAEGDAITAAIPDAVQVAGADATDHKESSLLGFASGEIRVLVTKPRIAGFGMNWQRCSRVLFLGISDSYEAFYQAVRRCWRFGQERPVHVHVVTSDAEEVVLANIIDKERKMEEMGKQMAGRVSAALARRTDAGQGYAERTDGAGWSMVRGDCVESLRMVEDETVGFSVFSPPFASLYTYSDSPRDMGNCRGEEDFFEHFRFLVEELFRVTKPGRLLSFHCMNLPTSKVRDGYIGISDFRGTLIRAFQAGGWIYHSEVVIWKDPVTAMQRTKALGLLHKQLKKDSCMSRQGIPDYLVTMRKPGENPERVEHTDASFPVSEWQGYASPVWMDINPSDTLQKTSAREHNDERHICPLQLEVIRRALRMWSRPGDLVLSPFAGIGSEGYVAVTEGREFLGIELKQSYYEQAARNLHAAEIHAASGGLFA